MSMSPGGWGPQQQSQWSGQQPNGEPQYGSPQQTPPQSPLGGNGCLVIIAVVFGALVVLSILGTLARQSFGTGLAMGLAGISVIAASVLVKKPPIRRAYVGITGGLLVISALAGLSVQLSEARTARDACDRTVNTLMGDTLQSGKAANNVEGFSAEADHGITMCKRAGMHDAASGLAAAKLEVQRQQESATALAKQREEEAVKQAAAAAIAQKEADWPETQKAIKAALSLATTRAKAGNWLDAEAKLNEAQGRLDALQGTKLEGAPEWTAFGKQIDTQRRAIAPQIERIRKKEAEELVKAAAIKALRGPEPTMSLWDGACQPCERFIKKNMNDPDSYSHIASTRPQIEDAYWTCAVKFRGKNAFGGKVVNARKCWIQQGQVVKIE